jgi:chromosome segregation ATPase
MIGNVSLGTDEINPLTHLLEVVTDPATYKQKLQTLADRTAEANQAIAQAYAAVSEAQVAMAEADRRKAAADASEAANEAKADQVRRLTEEIEAKRLAAEHKQARLEELLTEWRKKLDLMPTWF